MTKYNANTRLEDPGRWRLKLDKFIEAGLWQFTDKMLLMSKRSRPPKSEPRAAENQLEIISQSAYNRRFAYARVIYAWNYVEWGGAPDTFFGTDQSRRVASLRLWLSFLKGPIPQFLELLRSSNIRYEEFEPAVDLRPTSGIFSKLSRRWRRIQSEHRMIRKVRDVGIKNAIVHIDILPTQSFLSLGGSRDNKRFYNLAQCSPQGFTAAMEVDANEIPGNFKVQVLACFLHERARSVVLSATIRKADR